MRAPASRPDRQHGLSLVELMVALTVGLLLTLGLFTMISRSSSAFQTQDDFARMQDNATAALRYLGDSIRHAGFYGYARDVTGLDVAVGGIATVNDCGSGASQANPAAANWAIAPWEPLRGFTLTTATVNGVLPCIRASNFIDGQVLVTRHGIGLPIPDPNSDGNLTDGLILQPNYTTTIYVQSDPNTGLVFYGTNFATHKGNGVTKTLPTGADADIFQWQTHVYYLRPCSRPTGAGGLACQGSDDAGRPIPTLVRQELVGSTMTEVPLVEGIERWNVTYGIDGDQNGVPERYDPTPGIANFVNVVSVRVSILVRAPNPTTEHDDSGKSYDLNGDGVADFTCTPGSDCGYKRKVFSQTFQVRNVAQRRQL
jgi:type IV pilus assembly protein PilW